MANKVVIRELLVALGVKADSKQVVAFDRGIDKVKETMSQAVVVGAKLTAGILATGAAMLYAATSTASHGDEMAKAAKRVGQSAEEYQELSFALERTGVQAAGVEMILKDGARRSAEAAEGAGQAAEAYGKLGVTLRENGKLKGFPRLLEEIADKIGGVQTEAEKVRLLGFIAGEEGGARLLPLLAEGSEGIRKLRMEARLYGAVMSDEAAAASEEFTDRMTDMKAIVGGVKTQIGLSLLPTLTRMLEGFRDWYLVNGEIIRQRIDLATEKVTRFIDDKLVPGLRRATWFLDEYAGGWERVGMAAAAVGTLFAGAKLTGALSLLGTGMSAAFYITSALVGALTGLTGFALGGTVVAFLGAFAAQVVTIAAMAASTALVLEDFWTFLNGGDSVIGRVLGYLLPGVDALGVFSEALEEVKRTGAATYDIIDALASVLGIDLAAAIDAAWNMFGPFIEAVRKAAGDALFLGLAQEAQKLLDVVQLLGDAVGLVADGLERVAAGIRGGGLEQLGKGAAVASLGPMTGMGALAASSLVPSLSAPGSSNQSVRGGDTTINNYGGSDGITSAMQRRQSEFVRDAERILKR